MENLGAMAYSRYTGFREITDRDVLELHCICYTFPYILRSEIIFTSKLRPINGMFNNSACTNSNNALFIDVTNFSVLQLRCDVIDFGQTLLSEMCKMRYLTGKTSILLQTSRVFLMFRS